MRWIRTASILLPLLLAAHSVSSREAGHAGAYREVHIVRSDIRPRRHNEQAIAQAIVQAHLASPAVWFEPYRIEGYPRTHPRVKAAARTISSISTRVKALGAKPRLCIDFRPDVYRRIGGMQDEATGLGSFDDAWIAQVPVTAHNTAVAAYDQTRIGNLVDLDWANALSDASCKGFQRDRTGALLRRPYRGTRSTGTCPFFYAGSVSDRRPTVFQWGGFFVADMRIEAERRWMARNLADRISDTGATCAMIGYKPGWYAFNDTGSHASRCWRPGDRNWNGIARPTPECRGKGLMDQTPYAAGEFRTALNDFLTRALDLAHSSGACAWYIAVTERDDFADKRWVLLDSTVRSHPCLLGEWASARMR